MKMNLTFYLFIITLFYCFSQFACCPDHPNVESVCWISSTSLRIFFNFRNRAITHDRSISSFSAATYDNNGNRQFGPYTISDGDTGFGGCSEESFITLTGLSTGDHYYVGVWVTDSSSVSSTVRCLESSNDCNGTLSNCLTCNNNHGCIPTSKSGVGSAGSIDTELCYNYPLTSTSNGCTQTACVQPLSGYTGNGLTNCGITTCAFDCT